MNIYTVDSHCAELYDRLETYTDDVELLLCLLEGMPAIRIYEPFCGTGRILIPLARAGHRLTGLDQAPEFLERCRQKLAAEGLKAALISASALDEPWPGGFDVVVLGGNCLYELPCAQDQEQCILRAARALKPGGQLFLDTSHMEGELADAWQDPVEKPCFPSGLCADGVCLESTIQTIWCDVSGKLALFRRRTRVVDADGRHTDYVYEQQKHPVSTGEVKGWLEKSGLVVEGLFGSRDGKPYTHASPRAIFWARKV